MLTDEAKKEYQKEYMKKRRKGLTESDGSNKENGADVRPIANEDVRPKLFWYTEGKRVELKECPEGCKVLSDGQVWRLGNKGNHGDNTVYLPGDVEACHIYSGEGNVEII